MSEGNLFSHAISNNEIVEFFTGQGEYFIRDPDYGEHVYGANFSGSIGTFLKENSPKQLNDAFSHFIKSLEITKIDLEHLLANLSAYFALKKQGKLTTATLFSSNDNIETQELMIYVKKIMASELYVSEKELINTHAAFIEKNAGKLISDILNGEK